MSGGRPVTTWETDAGPIEVPADAPGPLNLFLMDMPANDLEECHTVIEGLRAVRAGELDDWLRGWDASWLRILPDGAYLRYAFRISPNEWQPFALADLAEVMAQVRAHLESSTT